MSGWIQDELDDAARAWDEMPDTYKTRVDADYWSNPREGTSRG